MPNEILGCLGDEAKMQVCFGPDIILSRQLGVNACSTCLVPAYLNLLEERDMFREQAEHDSLTLLFNRRMFEAVLEQRINTGETFGILFIDLESFKAVNTRELHAGGDAMLKQTAQYLVEFFGNTLRSDDLIARIGGDEFCVILNPAREEGVLDEESIENIKERLKQSYQSVPAVAEYNQKHDHVDELAMYVGHAIWHAGLSAEQLMEIAEPPKSDFTEK